MNTILSFLIALCMAFSGGYYSEDPAAASSMTTIVRDILITVNGEEYALNPSVRIGAFTEGDSAVLDFAMPLGEETLFPVQAKIDETGVSVLMGSSNTAYTFSGELLGSLMEIEDMPAEDAEFMESYASMLSAAAKMDREPTAEEIEAITALSEKLLADAEQEDCTFDVNGEEIAGTRYALSMDHAALMELCDTLFSTVGGDYLVHYMNTMMALTGEEVPELHSVSDLYAMIGMEVSLEGDVCTDGVRTHSNLNMTFTIDETKMFDYVPAEGETAPEPVVFTVPMEVIAYDEDSVSFFFPIEIEEEDTVFHLMAEIEGKNIALSANMAVEDVTMDMYISSETAEEGTELTYFNLSIGDGTTVFSGEFSCESVDYKNSVSNVSFGFLDEEIDFAASYIVEVTDAPFEDRISAAEKEILSTEEDLENCTGLMMAAMALAGDAETLMSDESLTAIVDAFAFITDSEVYEESSGDVSDLSFELPEFAWLPEGYELDDTVVDTYIDSVDLYFEYTGPSKIAKPSLVVTVYSMENSEYETMILGEDGALSPLEGSLITIERQEEWTYVRGVVEGYELHINYYGDDLTNEDIAAFFSGVSQPEPAEETTSKGVDVAGANKI